ncbi:MAG: LysR family transcriptional regulator [Pseudomonadota bacterium]
MTPQSAHFGRLGAADIRLLRTFATVVEHGGFTEALEALAVAPSTLSTDIGNLEKRLGVRLCGRGRGGFRLTERGREIYQESLVLFAAMEVFEAKVAAMKGRLIGELRIGLIDNSVFDPATRLPGTIARFAERYPDVHIAVSVLSPEEIEEALPAGRLDLGIGVFPRKRAGFANVAVFSEMLDLYCGRDHALFSRAPDRLAEADLADAALAKGIYLPPPGQGLRGLLAAPGASAQQAEGLAFLIQSGRFIGYLPRRYAAIWVDAGLMRPLLPEIASCATKFHIITHQEPEPSPVLRAFLEELRGQAG